MPRSEQSSVPTITKATWKNGRLLSIIAIVGSITLGFLGTAALVRYFKTRGPLLAVENPNRQIPPSEGDNRTPHVVFAIENAGSSLLHIKRITTSCGCTMIEAPKSVLEPGERSSIHVTGVRPAVGAPATVTVTVLSDSRDEPIKKLQITGYSEKGAPYVFSCSELVALDDVRENDRVQEFWIRTIEKERVPPWIVACDSTLPFVHISLKGQKTEIYREGFVQRTYFLQARIAVLPEPGEYRGFVALPDSSDLSVPVLVQVPHPIKSSPRALFASVSPDKSATFQLMVASTTGQPLPKLSLSASPDDQILIDPIGQEQPDSQTYKGFGVRVLPKKNNALFLGQVFVQNEETSTMLRIPVVLYSNAKTLGK